MKRREVVVHDLRVTLDLMEDWLMEWQWMTMSGLLNGMAENAEH